MGEVKEQSKTYVLPTKYNEMSPIEQQATLRSAILNFLDAVQVGATLQEIKVALQAPNEATLRKQLQYLSSTQQIYYDPIGRDPAYYRNGRLAHPTLQENFRASPRTAYSIRTYSDALTGRYISITEYAESALGEQKAKGGIRIDVADLAEFITILNKISHRIEKDPAILDQPMVTGTTARRRT